MPGTTATRYDAEFKIETVRKFFTEWNGRFLHKFAKHVDVNRSVLYGWIEKYGPTCAGVEKKWDSSTHLRENQKLKILVETKDLPPAELCAYLRKNGLYRETLLQWRQETRDHVKKRRQKNNPISSEQVKTADLMRRVSQLEKELKTKDKRLKEAEALLDLKKKVQTLLGDDEGKK